MAKALDRVAFLGVCCEKDNPALWVNLQDLPSSIQTGPLASAPHARCSQAGPLKEILSAVFWQWCRLSRHGFNPLFVPTPVAKLGVGANQILPGPKLRDSNCMIPFSSIHSRCTRGLRLVIPGR